jgi:hypothetical protein
MKIIILMVILCGTSAVAQTGPKPDKNIFNGRDLRGWTALDMSYWSVKDGSIVGEARDPVPHNQFLWSEVEVADFYLSVDVKLTPQDGNAGIQFRSSRLESGQAVGYQADAGLGNVLWGKLYHEHGRKKLDWNDKAAAAVKPGQWNRYEILAIGRQIWTAVNGTVCTALADPQGELSGYIALQIHSGPPQTVCYKINTLIHNPDCTLAGKSETELKALLRPPDTFGSR